jgi:hypothetical protein
MPPISWTRPFGCFAHRCESRRKDVVQRRAVFQLFAEILRLGAKVLVRQSLDLSFQSVDLVNSRPE